MEHRELVETYLRRHPPEVSEHTFTNLFAWRGARATFVLEAEDTLLVLAEGMEGLAMWGPPVGQATLPEAFSLAEELVDRPVLSAECIPEAALSGLEGAHFEVEPDRNNSDYVYRRSDLAELEGRRYHSKRNMVDRCLATHECVYEEIVASNLNEVADMQDRWCQERNCGREPALCDEYQAIRQVLTCWADLSVFGGAVRVDGTIEAYTVGEPLNDNTAVIHFEKAMSRVEGLYQVVNQWFCRNHLGRFEYVNREQDLGIPGLRKAKKSYYPSHMVNKYVVRVVGAGMQAGAHAVDAAGRCPE